MRFSLFSVFFWSSISLSIGKETRYLREYYEMKERDDDDSRGAVDTRIINGVEAERGRHNYFVRLYGTNQCGGVLIAPDVAITNAHCGE
jgi:secreted trypsin-like serine protease